MSRCRCREAKQLSRAQGGAARPGALQRGELPVRPVRVPHPRLEELQEQKSSPCFIYFYCYENIFKQWRIQGGEGEGGVHGFLCLDQIPHN